MAASFARWRRLVPLGWLLSSKLVRNLVAVGSGTAIGQAVVFAFSPLITRIYSPDAFGLQGVFLSLVSILSPVITLRYPMAIVLSADDAEAQNITRLSMTIAFTFSVVLGLMLLGFREPVATLLGGAALGNTIYFLPLALLCVAFQDVADYRTARLGTFHLVAVVTVVQAFVTNLARVLGGLIAPVAMTLMAITSIAPAVQAVLLFRGNHGRFGTMPRFDLARLGGLAKAHWEFAFYRAPTDVINAAAQSVPVVLLASMFSPSAAGFYVLARSVINVPVNVIGSAIGNILYSRFVEIDHLDGEISNTVLKVAVVLIIFPGIPIVAVSQFYPHIFIHVFGVEWVEAGHYAKWMTLWVVSMIVNIPFVRSLPVIRKQNVHFFMNIIMLILGAASIVIGRYVYNSDGYSVALYSVIIFSCYTLQIIVYYWLIRRYDFDKGRIN